MFLTAKELRDLTGKQRFGAMVTALNAMGISHKVRPDGFPVVLRSELERDSRPAKRAANIHWDLV